jgi:transposase
MGLENTNIKSKKLPKKELLRPDEVADYLDVSLSTIYREMEAYEDSRGNEGLAWIIVRGLKRCKRKEVLKYCQRKPWDKPTIPSMMD